MPSENDQQKLNTAFLNFTKNLPFYGYVLMNIDSKNARDVFKKIRRKKISFGFSKLNDYQIKLLLKRLNYLLKMRTTGITGLGTGVEFQ